jgi:hypothetical protein
MVGCKPGWDWNTKQDIRIIKRIEKLEEDLNVGKREECILMERHMYSGKNRAKGERERMRKGRGEKA